MICKRFSPDWDTTAGKKQNTTLTHLNIFTLIKFNGLRHYLYFYFIDKAEEEEEKKNVQARKQDKQTNTILIIRLMQKKKTWHGLTWI